MVTGIGTDILQKSRIENIYEKLAKKILGREELGIYERKKDKISYIAKRFCAKEAIAKALGTGIGKEYGFKDLQILNDEKGKPYVFGRDDILISISDEKEYIVAFAILK